MATSESQKECSVYILIDHTNPKDTPVGVLLNVCWGDPRKESDCEYGVAKFVHGKWWNYTSSNPHSRGRECAPPTGWCGIYQFNI